MGHACGCHAKPSTGASGVVSAETSVAELATDPRIRPVLAAAGLDTCCGGHLALREAAASIGAPLPALLVAIAAARGELPAAGGGSTTTNIDVRGLEPPEPMVRVLQRIDTLEVGEELTVIHDRRPVFLYPQLEARGFAHETDEPSAGVVRIRIRKTA